MSDSESCCSEIKQYLLSKGFPAGPSFVSQQTALQGEARGGGCCGMALSSAQHGQGDGWWGPNPAAGLPKLVGFGQAAP